MPVKFAAGAGFRHVLGNDDVHDVRDFQRPFAGPCVIMSVCVQMLVPLLSSLLEKFFSMMGDLGIDDVRSVFGILLPPISLVCLICFVCGAFPAQIVSTLDLLITKFSAELAVVAVPIVAKLVRVPRLHFMDSMASFVLLLSRHITIPALCGRVLPTPPPKVCRFWLGFNIDPFLYLVLCSRWRLLWGITLRMKTVKTKNSA